MWPPFFVAFFVPEACDMKNGGSLTAQYVEISLAKYSIYSKIYVG